MPSTSDKRPQTLSGEGSLLRLRLRYPDVQTFVERYASNVSRSFVYLASKSPKPVGTPIRFELLLVDGKTRVVRGEGTVAWVREVDDQNPNRPCGMGVRVTQLDADSTRLVERIEAFKRARGIPDELQPPAVPAVHEEEKKIPVTDDDLMGLLDAAGVQRAVARARTLVGGDLDEVLAALEGGTPLVVADETLRPGNTLPETREPLFADDEEPTSLARIPTRDEPTFLTPRAELLDNTSPEVPLADESSAPPLPPPPMTAFAPDEELSVVTHPPVLPSLEDEVMVGVDLGDDLGDDESNPDHTHVAAPPLDLGGDEPSSDVEAVLDEALDLALADATAEKASPRPKEGGFFSKLFKK
jgi:uncharacterized protein (TIGR02266 family)